jgi:Ca2+-binding EF-hand superfamily protein
MKLFSVQVNKIEKKKKIENPSCLNILGLSKKQINSLWIRFHELDCDGQGEAKGYKGYLDADDLYRVPKFGANPIAPRLIKVIFDDYGSNGKLTFGQFVEFMSTFAQRGRQRRRSSVATILSTSAKTDLESIKYSPGDSAKIRKVKFIFRVK